MRFHYPIALMSCALLVLGLGCISSPPTPQDKAPEAQVSPKDSGKVKSPAEPAVPGKAEVSADGGGKESPSGGGEGLPALEGLPEDVKRSLQQLERDRTLQENAQESVIANYLTSANRLMADGRPRQAREFVIQALKVRPGHAEAIDLLNRIDYVLSNRDQGAAVFKGLENLVQVKVQEALVEARAHYNKGVDLFNALAYDDALKEFERVLEIIRWAPYHVDLSGYRERVEAYVHRCNKLKGLEQLRRTRAIQEKATGIAMAEERQRRRREIQKVELLFKQSVLLFEQRQYIKAERLARQVLAQNPRHKLARRLIDDCIEARHMVQEKRFVNKKVEEWRKLLMSFDELKVPYNDIARWPSLHKWKRIIHRKIPGMGGFDEESDPAIRRIQSVLKNETISLDFKDAALKDVVDFIRNTKNINVVVDPQVLTDFESEGKTVNLQVDELNLGDAMDILMRFNSLKYTFRNKVLFVTNAEGAYGAAIMRLHDVRDLTRKLEHFKGPDLELKGGADGDAAPPIFDEGDEEQEVVQTSDLIDMIREAVATDTWDQGDFRITQIHGMLLVSHTPQVHREIGKLLDDLRRYSGLLVTVEARFLTVEDDFLEDIGADLRGLGNEKGTDAYLDDVTVGME
ncbi:MAG: tetratricopeptide repeat protein, partial [Planctomycetota bacterium]